MSDTTQILHALHIASATRRDARDTACEPPPQGTPADTHRAMAACTLAPAPAAATAPTIGTAPDTPSLFAAQVLAPAATATPAAPPAGKANRGRSAENQRSADMLDGHRTRLRARFDRGETLADYELLELVLFRAIPRRDTKPIAKAMIAMFGSFAEALSAPAARLTEIDGVGARVVSDMRIVRAAAERFALAELQSRPTLSSTDAVADYYRTKLKSADREEFHVLFLDKRNQFLASECAGVGTVDHTPVYPREVIARALAHGATAVVLVHNHPSGDPTPSRADVTMTEQIIRATGAVDVSVHDHIIIAGNRYLSMRGEGFI